MMRNKALVFAVVVLGAACPAGVAQTADLVAVVSKPVSRVVELPGELLPFQIVSLHAKVGGYVERVLADRGTMVKKGDLLVELSAPEMSAQIAEAESKVHAAEAEQLQAEAQLAAVQSTYDRLQKAAETPGAVAANEVVQAQKQVESAKALLNARRLGIQTLEAAVKSLKDLQSYLKISAPFDGVITERMAHPGALVGGSNDLALLVIQELTHLRLVVPVPEENVSGIVNGASVPFQVPAWPERSFSGKIARISHAIDQKTRTMAIELDVMNRDGSLAPGMYPAVKWPVRRPGSSLFVPKTSVVTTTERTFVIRNHGGKAEWVDVKKGAADGDLVEVIGSLQAGDKVVRRATDEMRNGTALAAASPKAR